MKTLGELRQLIIEHDGTLQIGALKFTYATEEDIDINFDGQLVMWFSKDKSDDCLLSAETFSISTDVNEAREALKEKNDGKREECKAKEALAEAEKKLTEARYSIGKIEAYEKLLIGRDITISK